MTLKPWRFASILALLVMFSACSVSPKIPQENNNTSVSTPTALNTNEHFKKGRALHLKWLNDNPETLSLIVRAEKHLRLALNARPDNILYQLSHYNVFATLLSEADKFNEKELLKEFQKLHPVLKGGAITPAFVTYSRSEINGDAPSTLLTHILRATTQNPDNSQNWYYAAQLYREQRHFWLASSCAQTSRNIAPDTADYNFELGLNLNLIASSNRCPKKHKELNKNAAYYFTEAARLAPDNPDYYAYSSQSYLRLGLTPLALVQAQKAFQLDTNEFTSQTLFNAQFFDGRFDEAWQTLNLMQHKLHMKVPELHALKIWQQLAHRDRKTTTIGIEAFINASNQSDESQNFKFYALIAPYILQLNDEETQNHFGAIIQNFSDQENALLHFMQKRETFNDEELREYLDPCKYNLVLFYRAIASKAHEKEQSQKMLRLYLQNTNEINSEAYWAHLLTSPKKLLAIHTSGG